MPSQESPPPQQRQSRSSLSSQTTGVAASAAAAQRRRQGSNGDLPPTSPSAVTFGSVNKGGHPKAHRQHVVGHGRGHPRPPSYGKNLNKLTKIVQNHGGDGAATAPKHHQRSQSHTPSTSPRSEHVKKVGSQPSLPRNASHTSLKKNKSQTTFSNNLSASSLKRESAVTENARRASRPEPTSRRSLNHPKPTAVRFDLGAVEGNPEDSGGWTEASSATESPAATRPSTSGNNSSRAESPHASRSLRMPDSPPASVPRDIPQQLTNRAGLGKLSSATHRSTPPSADAITSRLLQRSQRGADPKTSNISATATPGPHSPGSLGSTPLTHAGSLSPDSNRGDSRDADRASSPSSRRHRVHYDPALGAAGYATSHPSVSAVVTPPSQAKGKSVSRVEQKILLQRESSALESPAMNAQSEGREMMRLWERAGVEYAVARNWRSPIQEATQRSMKRKAGVSAMPLIPSSLPSRRGEMPGDHRETRMGLSQSLTESVTGRRADLPRALLGSGAEGLREGEDDEDTSTEAMLRRMWERADIPIDRE